VGRESIVRERVGIGMNHETRAELYKVDGASSRMRSDESLSAGTGRSREC